MTINDLMARGGALNDVQLLNEKLKRPKPYVEMVK